jgi:hypothetical protein
MPLVSETVAPSIYMFHWNGVVTVQEIIDANTEIAEKHNAETDGAPFVAVVNLEQNQRMPLNTLQLRNVFVKFPNMVGVVVVNSHPVARIIAKTLQNIMTDLKRPIVFVEDEAEIVPAAQQILDHPSSQEKTV